MGINGLLLYRILESEAPHTAISCGLAIKETLPISIFLAVSTVNKVSYKLYRRGLSLVQLATEYASTRVPQSVLSLSKLY